ncbi:MAG: DUF308 domain-containing protein [Flavobacteriales bacterium]|jgi:hypothetical protein|nr:DUF308 domain-containing protein [Flavobacteriales bacterium]
MIKKIDKGYSFGISHRVTGAAFLVTGGFAVVLSFFGGGNWVSLLFGTFLFVAGSIMLFAKEMIIINYKEKTFKNQLNVFGVTYTKENDLVKYRDISIISKRYSYDDSYDDNTESYYETGGDYIYKHDLVFLTPKHLGRLLISQFDDYEEALELGKVVAKYTGKPLVKYSPQRISKRR